MLSIATPQPIHCAVDHASQWAERNLSTLQTTAIEAGRIWDNLIQATQKESKASVQEAVITRLQDIHQALESHLEQGDLPAALEMMNAIADQIEQWHAVSQSQAVQRSDFFGAIEHWVKEIVALMLKMLSNTHVLEEVQQQKLQARCAHIVSRLDSIRTLFSEKQLELEQLFQSAHHPYHADLETLQHMLQKRDQYQEVLRHTDSKITALEKNFERYKSESCSTKAPTKHAYYWNAMAFLKAVFEAYKNSPDTVGAISHILQSAKAFVKEYIETGAIQIHGPASSQKNMETFEIYLKIAELKQLRETTVQSISEMEHRIELQQHKSRASEFKTEALQKQLSQLAQMQTKADHLVQFMISGMHWV